MKKALMLSILVIMFVCSCYTNSFALSAYTDFCGDYKLDDNIIPKLSEIMAKETQFGELTSARLFIDNIGSSNIIYTFVDDISVPGVYTINFLSIDYNIRKIDYLWKNLFELVPTGNARLETVSSLPGGKCVHTNKNITLPTSAPYDRIYFKKTYEEKHIIIESDIKLIFREY